MGVRIQKAAPLKVMETLTSLIKVPGALVPLKSIRTEARVIGALRYPTYQAPLNQGPVMKPLEFLSGRVFGGRGGVLEWRSWGRKNQRIFLLRSSDSMSYTGKSAFSYFCSRHLCITSVLFIFRKIYISIQLVSRYLAQGQVDVS